MKTVFVGAVENASEPFWAMLSCVLFSIGISAFGVSVPHFTASETGLLPPRVFWV